MKERETERLSEVKEIGIKIRERHRHIQRDGERHKHRDTEGETGVETWRDRDDERQSSCLSSPYFSSFAQGLPGRGDCLPRNTPKSSPTHLYTWASFSGFLPLAKM